MRASATVKKCKECDAALARDQQYCLACGARCGELPSRVAKLVAAFDTPTPPMIAGVPPAAATIVLTDPFTALFTAINDWVESAKYPTPRVAALAVMTLLAFGVVLGSVVGATSPAAPLYVLSPATPVAAPTAAPSAVAPPGAIVAGETAEEQAAPAEEVASQPPSDPSASKINRVWLIVLSGQGYGSTFGNPQAQSYLTSELAGKGLLMQNYYAVAQGELANSVAIVSGQGPTWQILNNCPEYTDLQPGAVDASTGQALGDGCVFPETVRTLPDAIAATGKSAYAYVEDIDNGANGRTTACSRPAPGAKDPDHVTDDANPYASWSNPLAYFKSFIAGPNCAFQLGGMKNLESDLAAGRSPAFSLVVPNRCHSGRDEPCAPGAPAGLATTDSFLRDAIAKITASKDYLDGGMIAITFDNAPQGRPDSDSTSCCGQAEFANLVNPPLVAAPTAPIDQTGPTGQTGSTGASGPTSVTAPAGAASIGRGGGGKVGLLLISPLISEGSVNSTDEANHFSLLLTIENWLATEKLGLTASPTITPLPESILNKSTQGG